MPSQFAVHWTLQPDIAFLNHGSFGASPRPVLAAQQAIRDRIEAEPVRFFSSELEALLDAARRELAAFLDAEPDDLTFVPNATTGINTVLRSLLPTLGSGDELLITDQAYNAAANAIRHVGELTGARVVVADVPFLGAEWDAVVEAVMTAVTSRTRLAVLDHVTSSTAMVWPVEHMVASLAERGVETLIDGAHAPGMLDVSIGRLAAAGCTYYTGDCHKWLCAPKGSGFLWVRRDRQATVRPLTISHGANSPRRDRSRFRLEFDWTGTHDPSAYLAVPDALRFLGGLLPDGWSELRHRNRQLAIEARDVLCTALGVPPPVPAALLGSMATVPLPGVNAPGAVQGLAPNGDAIHDALLRDHRIQVMVTPWPMRPEGRPWRRLVRISAQLYNEPDEYRRLGSALVEVMTSGVGEKPI